MISKIIFTLAMVCVVNASVLAVSDDDPEIEVASDTKSCELRACEKLCRRLNFPGGACVEGRCKCDHFRNEEDEDSENLLSDLENAVLQQDDLETEVEASLNRCNVKACDWMCRRLNMTSGSCVEGHCKCEKSSKAEDAVTEPNIEDLVPIRACNNKKCHQLCRKQKFRGGSCLGANCYCNKFLSMQDDEVSVESLPVSELSEDPTKRGCDMRACHQLCRRLKLPGGVCVNGRCKCDLFFGTEEDAVDDYSELDARRVCEISKCGRKCTRRGYEGATCVKGRCKCYNISKSPVLELSEDPTELGCNTQACNELCRRHEFPGGACVNGNCKCDFFAAEDAVDEYSELATRPSCKIRRCNRICARRGYASANCINGECNCRNKIKIEDASAAKDFTSDENEESNDVFLNEEELTASGPSACNTVNCNEMCHRLQYAGGWCQSGQCQCY